MALNIKNEQVDRMARELARRRGESITDAISTALEEALKRERSKVRPPGLADELLAIGKRYSALPVLDDRSDDEILGYDEHGIPR